MVVPSVDCGMNDSRYSKKKNRGVLTVQFAVRLTFLLAPGLPGYCTAMTSSTAVQYSNSIVACRQPGTAASTNFNSGFHILVCTLIFFLSQYSSFAHSRTVCMRGLKVLEFSVYSPLTVTDCYRFVQRPCSIRRGSVAALMRAKTKHHAARRAEHAAWSVNV